MPMSMTRTHPASHMKVAHANANLSFSDCKASPVGQILTRSFSGECWTNVLTCGRLLYHPESAEVCIAVVGCRRYVFTRDLASGWRGVQSFGGKATCQKVRLGSRNSTPTFICSPGNLSMCTTTHSSAPFVWIFDRVSR